jgi:hypothetical protein
MANSAAYAVQSTEVIFRGLCDDCVAGSPASII